MNYIEVWIGIKPFSEDFAEQIIAQIGELPFESFSIESPYLKAYIPEERFSCRNLKTLLSAYGSNTEFSITTETHFIREENWNILWESNFTPITFEKLCTVKASFHKGLSRTKYNITIDPNLAFGTGHHQTTYLMIESLLEEKVKGFRVLDVGCGTGILSILSAKMGAKPPVHAIDIDHLAVDSTKDNSHKNRVANKITCLLGDASVIQAARYDLVLANINRNIILSDIETYSKALSFGGRLFLSGFYTEDIPLILEEANKFGLEYLSKNSRENWAVLKLKKCI
ncbi:MAG: 50S ribosomal protein L11 methyltransferase [Bacteroidales bacterium]